MPVIKLNFMDKLPNSGRNYIYATVGNFLPVKNYSIRTTITVRSDIHYYFLKFLYEKKSSIVAQLPTCSDQIAWLTYKLKVECKLRCFLSLTFSDHNCDIICEAFISHYK